MIDVSAIIAADAPMTLGGVPTGLLPWLLAETARAASGRAVFIAPDDAAAMQIVEAAPFFAPELDCLWLPAWDSLPYDRASPSLRTMADRLTAMAQLVRTPVRPQLLVTTVNAALQRMLPRARFAAMSARLAPGISIDRDALARLLAVNGYVRSDIVREPGEFAVRGGIVDLYPSGAAAALRLDFFGDEIEQLRSFDPADQRTLGLVDGFDLLPVSEVLLTDDAVRTFRTGYRERFGAAATADPLYQAVSEGRRIVGMENWLPLFEPELETLFDYLHSGDVVIRDAGSEAAAQQRFDAIADYYNTRREAPSAAAGGYRPLLPDALYLSPDEWQASLISARAHLAIPFDAPADPASRIDIGAHAARDFAPERAAQANVYDAVAAHINANRAMDMRAICASYSIGARERLAGLMADHGVDRIAPAESWQQALGLCAEGFVALIVLPIEHGFRVDSIELLSEQDMLGDRLVRRTRKRRAADSLLHELQTLTPGDLVVHADHGIGRYDGLVTLSIGRAPHDCVALVYDGGDKLYVPVENIDVLTRYGSDSEGVGLDRLGGASWQARKARMKDRIREIAGELLAVAAARATREAERIDTEAGTLAEFVARFPYSETEDQLRAVDDVLRDLEAGRPMDRLIVGDVGFGKTEVALRAAFAAAMAGQQVAVV